MTTILRSIWRDQRGSQSLETAGVAVAVALIVVALLGAASGTLAPAIQRGVECAVSIVMGSGSCAPGAGAGGGTPGAQGTSGTPDKPWWQRAWDWTRDKVGDFFKGAWNWLKGAWSWLWQDREATWWKNFLGWLADKGWLGKAGAGVLDFAMNFLFGIGPDGKFTWGGGIISTLLTAAIALDGVGLLGKIPGLGRILMVGGKLSEIFEAIKGSRVFTWLAGTRLGKWLAGLKAGGFTDLLEGKWGSVLKELSPLIAAKVPWLGKFLNSEFGKTALNWTWRLVKDGPVGLARDVTGFIVKKLGPPWAKKLLDAKGWQRLWDWIRNPTFPWPFSS